jgi:hypothetical protein
MVFRERYGCLICHEKNKIDLVSKWIKHTIPYTKVLKHKAFQLKKTGGGNNLIRG